MAISNPFVASFGVVPPELAGRLHVLNEFDLGLEGPAGNSNRAMLLIGKRGMGKTVLLETAERRARTLGWIAVTASASPTSGFIERLTGAVQERLREQLSWWRRIKGVNALGFGVTLSDAQSMDNRLELLLTSLSERLDKKGAGVIITVDELQAADVDEARAVGNVLQIVANRRRLPIVFVGAGLPSLERSLLTGQQATFLQRCVRYSIERIEREEVRRALAKPLERVNVPVEDDALEVMIEATNGYPYMVQLVGEKVWKAAENPSKGLKLMHAEIGVSAAHKQLAQTVIEPEFNRLNRAGRALLGHFADSEGTLTFSYLAEATRSEDEELLNERLRQMIDAGLVDRVDGDRYEFAFPTTREWVKSRLDPGSDVDDAPWRVPTPATPAENGTHQLSRRTRIEMTLRRYPEDSYRSAARRRDEPAAYVYRVAIDTGLTRFRWQDLLIHLRSKLRARSHR